MPRPRARLSNARDQGDVWHIDKPQANDLHPTMKPVKLVERAIRNSSKTRDTVLDPFAGSGSTAIACEIAGRSGRLIEIDLRYCDVTVRRWQEYVGVAATLGLNVYHLLDFGSLVSSKDFLANAAPVPDERRATSTLNDRFGS